MSTNRTPNLIAARFISTEAVVQVAAFVATDRTVNVWFRTQPDAATPKPRWAEAKVPASLWPTKSPGALRGATGTLQGFLSRKVTGEGPVKVEGIWSLDFTPDEHTALDTGGDLNSLRTRIARLFDGTPPRAIAQDSLNGAAAWLLEHPIVAMVDGGLEAFTESILTAAPVAAVLTKDEVKGITLESGKTFVPRAWWNGLTDVTFLRQAREHDLFVLLVGPPGTGKSALVEASFREEYDAAGLSFFEDALVVGTMDTTVQDLLGGVSQDEDGIFKFTPGKAIKCAEAGVPLFIDEALLIDPRVLSAMYSLIDGRRVLPLPEEYRYVSPDGVKNAVHAKPGFYVVFAGNPDVPGAVISEALASRCTLKPEYLTDFDTAEVLMGKVHEQIVTVARNMETKRQNGEVLWAPQMRDLLGYRDTAAAFGTEVALSNLLANCTSESDREVLTDVIARVIGLSNIRPFRM